MLLAFLAATAVAVARQADLFAAVMLFAIYSLLSAALFMLLGAVDVAMTEAAVGVGVSTVLMLGALGRTTAREKPPRRRWLPLLIVGVTGAALLYATTDMPAFGDPAAPIHQHVAPSYIGETATEIGVPNVVTAVLASYRGFDTLGEVTVVFTAGIAVLALMRRRALRSFLPQPPRGD